MICGSVRRITAAISKSHIKQCYLLATPTQWKHQRGSNVNILKIKEAILLHCSFTEVHCEYSIRFRLKDLPAQVQKNHVMSSSCCCVRGFEISVRGTINCSIIPGNRPVDLKPASQATFTLQAFLLNSDLLLKIPFFLVVCSDDMFKCGLSADCNVNSSLS